MWLTLSPLVTSTWSGSCYRFGREFTVNEDYVTSDEAAEIVRRPVSTLAYWRHRGEGPPYAKVGRRVRYRRLDVEAWLSEQFAKSNPLRA
jgi:hypothetical protein